MEETGSTFIKTKILKNSALKVDIWNFWIELIPLQYLYQFGHNTLLKIKERSGTSSSKFVADDGSAVATSSAVSSTSVKPKSVEITDLSFLTPKSNLFGGFYEKNTSYFNFDLSGCADVLLYAMSFQTVSSNGYITAGYSDRVWIFRIFYILISLDLIEIRTTLHNSGCTEKYCGVNSIIQVLWDQRFQF